MKTFKEFINENIKDLLQGRSEDDIEKRLEGLDDIEKIKMVLQYDLPEKYLPQKYYDIVNEYITSIKNSVKELKNILNKPVINVESYIEIFNTIILAYTHFSNVEDQYDDLEVDEIIHEISELDEDRIKIIVWYNYTDDYETFYTTYDKLNFFDLDMLDKKLKKAIKTFNSINENIKDLLQPKSDDEIIKALEGLSDSDKIKQIIINQLDFNLLPRNKDGICLYDDWLIISKSNITELPDNLLVKGWVLCDHNKLSKLPKGLTVLGSLYCQHNLLTEIPNDIYVKGKLLCYDNAKVLELPDGAEVGEFQNIEVIESMYESVKDLLQPKSYDEIKKNLNYLNAFDKTNMIIKYQLDSKLMPSKDDMIKSLDVVNTLDKIRYIYRFDLPKKYLPSDKDIKEALKNVSVPSIISWVRTFKLSEKLLPILNKIKEHIKKLDNNDQIMFIFENGLPYDLLPRTKDGICKFYKYYNTDLNIQNIGLTKLPDNLTVYNNLDCSNNNLKELPKGLKVYKHLFCDSNLLTELPDDLYVMGDVYCGNNKAKLKLPKGAVVIGEIIN